MSSTSHSRTGGQSTSMTMQASKPVVIPIRGGGRSTSRKGMATPTPKGEHNRGYTRPARDTDHQPGMIPPAVAVLLAVTSIPPPKKSTPSRKGRQHGGGRAHQETVMALLDEKLLDETLAKSTASKSPLGILLSSTDELDQDEAEDGSTGKQASLFAEPMSLEAVPLLEADDSSSTDSFSELSSPPSSSEGKKANQRRKEKSLSSPAIESCSSDHPLLGGRNPLYDPDDDAPEYNLPTASPSNRPKASQALPVRRQSSLKSNLTASLRVLRSAARSFSNFTTTQAIHTDGFLARSILSISPQFTDERRPLPSDETPTPALRRYLNPLQPSKQQYQQTQYFNTPYHHLHSIPFRIRSKERELCTASIQLQTYHRQKQKPSPSSTTSSYTPSNNSPCIPAQESESPMNYNRPREPRENSDFLRVIVLEMNMRRRGKLSDTAPGRARFVLPPRRSLISPATAGLVQRDTRRMSLDDLMVGGGGGMTTGVPQRWIGIVPK